MHSGDFRVGTAAHLHSVCRRAASRESARWRERCGCSPPADSGLDLEPHRRVAPRRKTGRTGHSMSPRSAGLHHRARGRRHFPPQGFPRTAARIAPKSDAALRDVYENCLDRQKFVVITSPVRFIPEELERNMISIELRPPDLIELVEFLRERCGGDAAQAGSEDFCTSCARALQGLTLDEARYALRRARGRAGFWACGAAGRARGEAAAGQSQRRDRIHCRRHRSR